MKCVHGFLDIPAHIPMFVIPKNFEDIRVEIDIKPSSDVLHLK